MDIDINIDNVDESNLNKMEVIEDKVVVNDEQLQNNVIAEVTPIFYGAFVKILSFLAQGMGSQDILDIYQGELTTKKSSGIIYSNMKELFESNSIRIADPSNAVKLMNLIKGGDIIIFTDDNIENEYVISQLIKNIPERIITLNKVDNNDDIIKKPELEESDKISTLEIEISSIEDIINAFKITDAGYYIIDIDKDNNIVSIRLSNNKFKEQFSTNEIVKSYKVYDLMMISKPGSYTIELFESNNNVWFKSISDVDLVKIDYFEKIEELTDFDSFSI